MDTERPAHPALLAWQTPAVALVAGIAKRSRKRRMIDDDCRRNSSRPPIGDPLNRKSKFLGHPGRATEEADHMFGITHEV